MNSLVNKMSPSEAIEKCMWFLYAWLNLSIASHYGIPIMAALPRTLHAKVCISTEAVCAFIVAKTAFFKSSFTTRSIPWYQKRDANN